MIPLKTDEEIEKLRESASILVETFRAVSRATRPGMTTSGLDRIAEDCIRSFGAQPAFKGYQGFPGSICASIEAEVVHGIPGKREIREGEIVSVDIGVLKNGYYSDAAYTFAMEPVEPKKAELLEITQKALHRGIRQCRQGNRLTDISHAIQTCVEEKGFSVVRDLVGHGIGKQLHEPPQIPNFGPPRSGPKLKAGMVFAIEPMINMGEKEIHILDDGWTVRTADGAPSAHFEHTVLITDSKPEILTLGIETAVGS